MKENYIAIKCKIQVNYPRIKLHKEPFLATSVLTLRGKMRSKPELLIKIANLLKFLQDRCKQYFPLPSSLSVSGDFVSHLWQVYIDRKWDRFWNRNHRIFLNKRYTTCLFTQLLSFTQLLISFSFLVKHQRFTYLTDKRKPSDTNRQWCHLEGCSAANIADE